MTQPWIVKIKNWLGGFCPGYWKSSYPTYGNPNMAGMMRNMDLRNPHGLKPGPNTYRLTAGDESGALNALVRSIMRGATASNVSYAIGGAKLHKISATAVTNAGIWPHTISATNPDGEDAKYYHGFVFYSYNASLTGDVGAYNPATDGFDDDFLSASAPHVGTFSLKTGYPHPMEVGGDDILYIGNKNYVSTLDIPSNVITEAAIDLPDDAVVTDLKWINQQLVITVNWPYLTGNNQIQQSVFIWNTVDESWVDEVPQIKRGGGMFKRNGVLFVFYEDISSDGKGRLGYLDGNVIKEVAAFNGTLPSYYQITEIDGFIVWVSTVGSEDLIFAWGGGLPNLPTRLMQLMKARHATIGGIGAPFGTIMVSSCVGTTSFEIAKADGYQKDAYYQSMLFEAALDKRMGIITQLKAACELVPAVADVGVGVYLYDDKARWLHTGTISYAADGQITRKIFQIMKRASTVYVKLDYSGFGTTSVVVIKDVAITGQAVDE